jgi:hypothetical protein
MCKFLGFPEWVLSPMGAATIILLQFVPKNIDGNVHALFLRRFPPKSL